MAKRIRWFIAIIFILCVVLYFIPFSHKIDTTQQGIQCRIGDKDYSENVSIYIKGKYNNFLFKNDTFDGLITIDKYKFTQNATETIMSYCDGYYILDYCRFNKYGSIDMNHLGTISFTPNMKNILIMVSEPIENAPNEWNDIDGLFISVPAKNHAQAIENANYISSRNKFLSTIDWD